MHLRRHFKIYHFCRNFSTLMVSKSSFERLPALEPLTSNYCKRFYQSYILNILKRKRTIVYPFFIVIICLFFIFNVLSYLQLSEGRIRLVDYAEQQQQHVDSESGLDIHEQRDRNRLFANIFSGKWAYNSPNALDRIIQRARLLNDNINELKNRSDALLKLATNISTTNVKGSASESPHGNVPFSLKEIQLGSEPTNKTIASMRETVRDMMRHAWKGYRDNAFGENEYRPISKTAHTTGLFGNAKIGATIVDSIDTLFIMGLKEEYNEAYKWISEKLSYNVSSRVSVFEANIRFLGGLLSIHTFTNDPMFLKHAVDLANRLLPAFHTVTGIPHALVNLMSGLSVNYFWANGGMSILSEFGTLHMEFSYLSELTNNSEYRDKVRRIRRVLLEMPLIRGLYPNYLHPVRRNWGSLHASLAGLGDSFYEYLIKEWIRSGDIEALNMYNDAMVAIEKYMIRQSDEGLVYIADYRQGNVGTKMDHLACFAGGMFALAAKHDTDPDRKTKFFHFAKEVTHTCHESYRRTATKLGPESFHFSNGVEAISRAAREKVYLLRPETFESYFYLWRLTKDPKYRDWAWEGVQALEKYCRNDGGYSGLRDVYSYETQNDDVQQSYFLAETLKYLYLIFSEDDLLPLDRWVFNTEAHPLPIKRAATM